MTTLDSSALSAWGALADLGCFLVIVGIVGESAELLVKWGKKKRFRDGFSLRFDEKNRRKLVLLIKVIKPKILPVETVFVGMVVTGLAIEFLGTHKANGILYKNNSDLVATNTIISLQVAVLNKEAADERSKAVALEQQIQNSDAKNWPVYELKADVKLRVLLIHEYLAPPSDFSASVDISESSSHFRKITFDCDGVESVPLMKFPIYHLSFLSPKPNSIRLSKSSWFREESAKSVATNLDTASLTISNFPFADAKVIGSIEITINDSMTTSFRIQSIQINGGFAVLTGITNGVLPYMPQ